MSVCTSVGAARDRANRAHNVPAKRMTVCTTGVTGALSRQTCSVANNSLFEPLFMDTVKKKKKNDPQDLGRHKKTWVASQVALCLMSLAQLPLNSMLVFKRD